MLRRTFLGPALCMSLLVHGQEPAPVEAPMTAFTDAVGLSLSKAQVIDKALAAWEYSFGLEPGARILSVDRESGTIEGEARFKYKSTMLIGREQSLGSVTYKVTISAHNGQCAVRVHDLMHTGNRASPHGPLDAGPVHDGVWPLLHYPSIGLSASRKLHDDIRARSGERITAVLRTFSARLRLLEGP